jgi:hypothetical protein
VAEDTPGDYKGSVCTHSSALGSAVLEVAQDRSKAGRLGGHKIGKLERITNLSRETNSRVTHCVTQE